MALSKHASHVWFGQQLNDTGALSTGDCCAAGNITERTERRQENRNVCFYVRFVGHCGHNFLWCLRFPTYKVQMGVLWV